MLLADKLQDIITESVVKMNLLDEIEFSNKPDPVKWSKKEILGHLVDSAINNLLRMTQLHYRDHIAIEYDQDRSVKINNYQEMTTNDVINLWKTYNTQLARIVRNLPQVLADRPIVLNGSAASGMLIMEEYIQHLLHHLNQILSPDYSTGKTYF